MSDDPSSEKGSSYNTTPRQRRRNKFNPFAVPTEPQGFYSPFWPLLVVFFAFILLLVYEISFLRFRSMSLHTQYARLATVAQKANAQTEFIKNLRSDLEALAPSDPNAALLVKEFFPPEAPAATTPAVGDPASTPAPDSAKDSAPAK